MSKAKKKVQLVVDMDELTLGEMDDVEMATGQEWGELFPAAEEGEVRRAMSPRQMIVLAYIAGKRDDPTFTYEDARGLKVTELSQDDAPKADAAPAEPPD